MGLYSKGTRSKGVTKKFQHAGQANVMQRSKHTKRDAYLAKEAFMKEAMARHLAAAERVFKPAGDGEAGDADGEADVSAPAAVATGASAPAPSDEAKAKAKAVKLRAKMGTTPGAPMQGAMRYEGKAGRRKGDGGDAAGDTKIGHLMKPLKGDEIDFACQVDTSAKLPKYARGKMTVVKKRKKNKRKNARATRMGE